MNVQHVTTIQLLKEYLKIENYKKISPMAQITELNNNQGFVFTDKSGFLWNIEILETGGFMVRKAVSINIDGEYSDQIQIFPIVGNKIKIK